MRRSLSGTVLGLLIVATTLLAQEGIQRGKIKKLDLDALPDDLHELASLRLRHPTASIADLARRCRPPTLLPSASMRFCSRAYGAASGRSSTTSTMP